MFSYKERPYEVSLLVGWLLVRTKSNFRGIISLFEIARHSSSVEPQAANGAHDSPLNSGREGWLSGPRQVSALPPLSLPV